MNGIIGPVPVVPDPTLKLEIYATMFFTPCEALRMRKIVVISDGSRRERHAFDAPAQWVAHIIEHIERTKEVVLQGTSQNTGLKQHFHVAVVLTHGLVGSRGSSAACTRADGWTCCGSSR
jgi:hypothetical protein